MANKMAALNWFGSIWSRLVWFGLVWLHLTAMILALIFVNCLCVKLNLFGFGEKELEQ